MTRALHKLAIPALSAALLVSSCTTHGGNTFVVAARVIAAVGTQDPITKAITACKYDPGSKETVFPPFDTASALALGVVLNNRLPSTSTPTRPESNDFTAEKFVINYESTGTGTVSIAEQTLPAQGSVPAGATGVAVGVVMPVTVATTLAGQPSVRVHLYVIGRLLDGTTVKSSDYEFIAVPSATALCTAGASVCFLCQAQ